VELWLVKTRGELLARPNAGRLTQPTPAEAMGCAIIYFASAFVGVEFSQLTSPSSAFWRHCQVWTQVNYVAIHIHRGPYNGMGKARWGCCCPMTACLADAWRFTIKMWLQKSSVVDIQFHQNHRSIYIIFIQDTTSTSTSQKTWHLNGTFTFWMYLFQFFIVVLVWVGSGSRQ